MINADQILIHITTNAYRGGLSRDFLTFTKKYYLENIKKFNDDLRIGVVNSDEPPTLIHCLKLEELESFFTEEEIRTFGDDYINRFPKEVKLKYSNTYEDPAKRTFISSKLLIPGKFYEKIDYPVLYLGKVKVYIYKDREYRYFKEIIDQYATISLFSLDLSIKTDVHQPFNNPRIINNINFYNTKPRFTKELSFEEITLQYMPNLDISVNNIVIPKLLDGTHRDTYRCELNKEIGKCEFLESKE